MITRIDEESYEITHGANVEGEELDEEETDKEDEANELYRDVNVNLEGRDTEMTNAARTIIQTTQVIEDTHVIITPVNPEGQQQSSSVTPRPKRVEVLQIWNGFRFLDKDISGWNLIQKEKMRHALEIMVSPQKEIHERHRLNVRQLRGCADDTKLFQYVQNLNGDNEIGILRLALDSKTFKIL
ncbi:hypothetical protein Tco_0792116 [Tanacetum coccineum]